MGRTTKRGEKEKMDEKNMNRQWQCQGVPGYPDLSGSTTKKNIFCVS